MVICDSMMESLARRLCVDRMTFSTTDDPELLGPSIA